MLSHDANSLNFIFYLLGELMHGVIGVVPGPEIVGHRIELLAGMQRGVPVAERDGDAGVVGRCYRGIVHQTPVAEAGIPLLRGGTIGVGENQDVARIGHPRRKQRIVFGRSRIFPLNVVAEPVQPVAGPLPAVLHAERAGPVVERRHIRNGRALQRCLRDIAAALHVVSSVRGRRIGEDRNPESGGGVVVRILHVADIESVEIAGILRLGQYRLFFIVDALGSASAVPRFIECGEQHGRQNGDDRNHHQQLDQGKWILFHLFFPPFAHNRQYVK